MQLVASLRASDEESSSIQLVTSAFVCFSAVQALEWLRRAAVRPRVGESVVQDPATESLLEAIGLLAQADARPLDGDEAVGEIRFLAESAVLINDRRVEALICPPRQTSSGIELAATERAREYVDRRGPTPVVHILLAASSVRGPRLASLPAVSVVDPDTPVDDLFAGAEQVRVDLTYADDLLAAA